MMRDKLRKILSFQDNLGWLSTLSFLFGLQLSLSLYVMSDYFKLVLGSDKVEWIYVLIFLFSFWGLWKMADLVKKWGQVRSFFLFLSVRGLALLAGSLFWSSYFGLFSVVVAFSFHLFLVVSLDLLIESLSKDSITGRIRGKQLALLNLGILSGPFLSGFMVNRLGFSVAFFLSSVVVFLMATILAFNFKLKSKQELSQGKQKALSWRGLKWLLKRKPDLKLIFSLAVLLRVFYAVTIVYFPLMLLEKGMDWSAVGLILTLMLLPFVFVQYPTGILADKKGEKEILAVALLLMAISLVWLFFVEVSPNSFWLVALILMLGRTGAALFEVGQDSYFYKKVNADDVRVINLFRTSTAVAYILSMTIFGLLSLIINSYQGLFLILALILILGFIPLSKLKDTK